MSGSWREGGEKLTTKKENWEKKCPTIQNPRRREARGIIHENTSAELKVRADICMTRRTQVTNAGQP